MKLKRHMHIAAALAAAAVLLCSSVPAAAASFTTSNSVLTLKTPDDTWLEIHDPDTWVTLGNGNDTITVLHYSNGESLPAPAVADGHYSKVFQTVLSTRNEVFIVTGSVVDATNFKAVRKAVQSTVIKKYDTKKAIGSQQPRNTPSYEIDDTGMTCYVTSSSLNVRAGYSTSEARLGSLSCGDEIWVTGIVMYGEEESGWYRINYNGSIGFVSSQFVSEDKPIVREEPRPANTGEEMTLYSNDGMVVTVYRFSDGIWYDEDSRSYTAEGAGWWACSDGGSFTSNPPVDKQGATMMLTNSYGNQEQIWQDEDGSWMDVAGIYYEAEGGGLWTDSYGNTWTSN